MVKEQEYSHPYYGMADELFEQRRPLVGQITKREIRAVSIHGLGLSSYSTVWDIGSGSGSIAIEAARIAQNGTVYAIEKNSESMELLHQNVLKYSSGNVEIVIGEAPDILKDLADPDAVFIGGSGGNILPIIKLVRTKIKTNGNVVVNLALLERPQAVYDELSRLGFAVDLSMITAARGQEVLDGKLRLQSLNPVFIVKGTLRKEDNRHG
ncbi:MAG: precorrin-6Y C5,15-methyltransferase (decarboxylating) subunit CbiT [Chloroflexota bacterium]|nr:precorrin-6Y C5,15-methyltransferase (decarboxylating) subunit CbiT [Chloroflexota bacterium]